MEINNIKEMEKHIVFDKNCDLTIKENDEKSYSFVVENNCKVSVLLDITSSLDLNIVVKDIGDLKIAILNKKNKNNIISNGVIEKEARFTCVIADFCKEATSLNSNVDLKGEYSTSKFVVSSTSNDKFKNTFIELTSEKTYDDIEYYIDQILELEENIIKLNNKSSTFEERNKTVDKIVAKTDNYKNKITEYFEKAQNLIIKNYFDKSFKSISNLEELDNYRRKLEHYGELIGRTDNYTFFDDYYTEKMSQLEHKSNVLENGGIETALEYKKPNKFVSWLRAIKNFVTGEKIHN